jgi:anti-anti-sigma regulatory factor
MDAAVGIGVAVAGEGGTAPSERYFSDDLEFLRLLAFDVIPGALRRRIPSRPNEPAKNVCEISESETSIAITLAGTLDSTEQQKIKKLCYLSADATRPLTIDFSGINDIENSCFAYLMLLQAHRRRCGLSTKVFPISSNVMLQRY